MRAVAWPAWASLRRESTRTDGDGGRDRLGVFVLFVEARVAGRGAQRRRRASVGSALLDVDGAVFGRREVVAFVAHVGLFRAEGRGDLPGRSAWMRWVRSLGS